jgi:hypothetical protein
VARAKRTNRAEARRKYRAAMNEPLEDADDLDAVAAAHADAATGDDVKPAPSKSSAASSPPGTARPRPSIALAFRGAFRPLDVPGDLRALPRLLIDKSFLIPVALIVAVAAVVIAFGGREMISRELSAFVLAPPPLAPVFIAGFLAPRASWLLGALLGVVQSIAVLAVISTPALGPLVGVPDSGVFASSMFISVLFGSFYAAAMAWYKRFLRGANPPRTAAASNKPAGKPKRGSQGRPALARRR